MNNSKFIKIAKIMLGTLVFITLVLAPLISRAQEKPTILERAKGAAKGAVLGGGVPGAIIGAATPAEIKQVAQAAGLGQLINIGSEIASAIGQGIMAVLGKALGFIIFGVNVIMGFIASILFTLGSFWLSTGLAMNQNLLASELVKIGFNITLQLANLGFVLGIIIIAFTTILRISSYELKQLLWKLIVAAILINFSLVIAGVLLDFSGVITQFFIDNVAGGSGGLIEKTTRFAENLAKQLGVQKLMETTPEFSAEGITEFGKNTFGAIASVFFVTAFTITAAGVIIITGAMIFVRYVYLTILLILMPIVWLMWIFPNVSYMWTNWWKKFVHWVFFLPALTFFLFLTVKIVETPGIFEFNAVGQQQAGAIAATGLLINNVWDTFGKMLAILGLMSGGILAANVVGLEGGKAVVGFAGSVKNWAMGTAGKIAKAPAQYLGTGATKTMARGGATLLSSRALRWIPGAQNTANRLAGLGSRQQEVEDYRKTNFANLTNDQFSSYIKTLPLGPVARNAVLAEAVKRKMLPKFSEKQLQDLVKAAEQANPGVLRENIPVVKEIFENMPHMVPKLIDMKKYTELKDASGKVIGSRLPDVARYEAIKDIVRKTTASKSINFAVDSLNDKDVIMSLSNSQLGAIAANGTDKQREAILNTLKDAEKMATENEKEWKKYSDSAIRIREFVNANAGLQAKIIAGTAGIESPAPPPKA